MTIDRKLSSFPNSPFKIPVDTELRRLFDECVRIATDNKINANNSWNLGLIDYFHDLTVLREGDSINFQKASCTLDGCVKIYSSRIDSVDSETRVLLNGLVSNDMDNVPETLDDDGNETKSKPKKKTHASGHTLESNVDAINVKKFDLEFNVDPLFKKTSADFDEGGARGLLLNHLHIGYDGRMIFDASNDAGFLHDYNPSEEMLNVGVDTEQLKVLFENILTNLEEKQVCPSFKEFQFNSNNLDFDPLQYLQANVNNLPDFVNAEPDEPMAIDDFDGYMPHDSFDDNAANVTAIPELLLDMRKTRLSIMPDEEGGDPADQAELGRGNDIGLFSYFDKALIRNWMGPEHWRPMPSKKEPTTTMVTRKKKVADQIDFFSPINMSTLFEKSNASMQLKASEKTRSDHLLPEDTHFTSSLFLKLFTKPTTQIRFKKQRSGTVAAMAQVHHEEEDYLEDQQILAELPENAPVFEDARKQKITNDMIAPPTQDYFSDSSMDDIEPMDLPNMEMPMVGDWKSNLIAEPKRMKMQHINYARVAKKVDVKKLKENLWQTLESEKGIQKEPIQTFSQVCTDLAQVYPEKKWKDISVAFCFICLLHLANENELIIHHPDHQDIASDLMIQRE